MFQLIVAVISIALVAALAIASIYYGGTAFQKSSLKANVTSLVNAGQQISGAQALYVTDYGVPTTFAGLDNGTYLSTAPSVPSIADGSATAGWSVVGETANSNGYAVIPFSAGTLADTTAVCTEVARQAGGNAVPQFFCSVSATAPAAAASASGNAAFAFKL